MNFGQMICFSLSLIILGAAMTMQVVALVATRSGLESAGERFLVTLPAVILLLVAVFFGWLGLVQSPWFA